MARTNRGAQSQHEDQHEDQHEGQAPEAESSITLDDLDAAFVLAAPLAATAAPKNKRSEVQAKMDAKVLEVHALWIKAGRPSVWGRQVESGCVVTYFLSPEAVSAREKLINKACAFHGNIRPKYGTQFVVTEELLSKFNLPAEYLGRKALSFTVVDKRERSTGTTATSAGEGASA